jgi:hypothetical protein
VRLVGEVPKLVGELSRSAGLRGLRKGICYANDRNFSHDYKLISEVAAAGGSFVLSLKNNAILKRLGPRTP